jgi:hypothetical protein
MTPESPQNLPEWRAAHAEYVSAEGDPDVRFIRRTRAAMRMRDIESGAGVPADRLSDTDALLALVAAIDALREKTGRGYSVSVLEDIRATWEVSQERRLKSRSVGDAHSSGLSTT